MAPVPKNLVVVGRVLDAWGLQGGIKLARYSPDADALLTAKLWWLTSPSGTRSYDVEMAQIHGAAVRALLHGITDRNAALNLKGAVVAVAREDFPALSAGEYYWVDLIGLEVVNPADVVLGRIRELMESGAHPILVVEGDPLGSGRFLVPFVDAVVREVDIPRGRVVVEWERDY